MLVWLSLWNEVQIICILSSWCHYHLVISCCSKIQIGLTFLVPAYQVVVEGKKVKSTIPHEECWWGAHLLYLALSLQVDSGTPVKSVARGHCNARPTVTFPFAGHRCPTTDTKLYCLVTEAHVCEQLAQCRYLTVERPRVELATSWVASQRRDHYTTRSLNRCMSKCAVPTAAHDAGCVCCLVVLICLCITFYCMYTVFPRIEAGP